MELRDKVVVVTGAGRGLGKQMSLMIAAKGARLAVVDMSEEEVEETARLCNESGNESRHYVADVSDESAVEQLFADVAAGFGRVDAVINNAGITRDGLLVKAREGEVLSKMSLDDWNAVINVDLRGVFLCAREAAVKMIENGNGGVIINISSISRAGNIGQTNYSAAKAGVAAMTVTWAGELARHGIRVAAIAPGFSNTRMVAGMPEKIRDRVTARVPLKRLAKPEEIGHTAIYILENDYFDGRVLEIDGGLRI
ncbi:MAG: SDR family oxidoreductase [Arenicellales bacterium]|jgi:3-oxoacyl-[acyl-carrier protein] reductase